MQNGRRRLNYLSKITISIFIQLIFLSTSLLAGCGRVKELNVPMKYPLFKAYDTYLEGELLGWCDYKHPIIPVLHDGNKIIFCKETALQNIAATVEIEGELLSCRFTQGETEKNEYLMVIITKNEGGENTITSYKVTNLLKQEEEVDLKIEKLFSQKTEYGKILFYNSFLKRTDREYKYPYIICYSKDKHELGIYNIDGALISTHVLGKHTAFIENADAQYGFYGFDGSKVLPFEILDDKISKKKSLTLEKEYNISNFAWIRGGHSNNNYSNNTRILVLNIEDDLYFIDKHEMNLITKDNIQLDDNIGQLIYSKKDDGLYYVAQNILGETYTKTYKKFLEGDFRLWQKNFSSFNVARYFISKKQKDGTAEDALILELIAMDKLYIRVGAFKPTMQSKIIHFLADRGYLKDFSIITEDGVYKLDLKSDAYGEYMEDMTPEFTQFQDLQ
ncbi:MAG: hypothetical protein R2883_00990 [Caldisericia bacterium]